MEFLILAGLLGSFFGLTGQESGDAPEDRSNDPDLPLATSINSDSLLDHALGEDSAPPDQDEPGVVIADPDSMVALPDEDSDQASGVIASSLLDIAVHDIATANWQGQDPHVMQGTEMDDHIVLGTNATTVISGLGNDMIDASNSSNALIYGDDGDTIRSSDTSEQASHFVIVADGEVLVEGGNGEATVLANGDGGEINGGGGDDILLSGSGSTTLGGGAGDDLLVSNATHLFSPSDSEAVSDYADGSIDILSGGEGNDTLVMSGEDFASGGEGSDTFNAYGFGATISDFNPSFDVLTIHFDDPLNPTENIEHPYDTLEGRISVESNDAGLSISIDSSPIVHLLGVQSSTIGIGAGDGMGGIVDLEGKDVMASDVAIILQVY